ncbi:hypothetical protein SKAU_G00155110 [Synaphobranchus kaupii]|uniref:Uncharacterized protein n=1 Tax=Synaphobranchus kaupii TaxID=118154 RepID=A0A9Q1FHI9_SYNKA|nr:hypothetical protein SKAU_G00155110 [Synaphobranchus kaupii]
MGKSGALARRECVGREPEKSTTHVTESEEQISPALPAPPFRVLLQATLNAHRARIAHLPISVHSGTQRRYSHLASLPPPVSLVTPHSESDPANEKDVAGAASGGRRRVKFHTARSLSADRRTAEASYCPPWTDKGLPRPHSPHPKPRIPVKAIARLFCLRREGKTGQKRGSRSSFRTPPVSAPPVSEKKQDFLLFPHHDPGVPVKDTVSIKALGLDFSSSAHRSTSASPSRPPNLLHI